MIGKWSSKTESLNPGPEHRLWSEVIALSKICDHYSPLTKL